MANPLYSSVRCPRCKGVKVTRYPKFQHCRKYWKTSDHQVNDELAESKSRPASQGADRLEVTW